MDRKRDEQVIYLKDLLFSALYKWKGILALGVALALVLCGVKAAGEWAGYQNSGSNEAQKITLERYEAKRTSLEKQVEDLRVSVHNQQSYIRESQLMKLDPYGFYETNLTVYVDTGYQIQPDMGYQDPDKTAAVISSYQVILTGETAVQAMADAMGTESRYLLELITIEVPEDTNTMCIRASYADEAGAEKLLEQLLLQIDHAQQQIAQSITDHQISVVEQYVQQKLDAEIDTIQKSEAERLTNLIGSLEGAQNELQSLKKPELSAQGLKDVVKAAVIFAVIGGILGVFLGVCAAWAGHIFGGKVYSARTLYNRTGLRVLGCVADTESRDSVIRFLRRMEGRSVMEAQQQSRLVAASVKGVCRDAKKLLVTGSLDASAGAGVVQALVQAMPQVQIVSCGSLLRDVAAVEALEDCDQVLLIEKCQKSVCMDIEQQCRIVADNGVKLAGCVLLDG